MRLAFALCSMLIKFPGEVMCLIRLTFLRSASKVTSHVTKVAPKCHSLKTHEQEYFQSKIGR